MDLGTIRSGFYCRIDVFDELAEFEPADERELPKKAALLVGSDTEFKRLFKFDE